MLKEHSLHRKQVRKFMIRFLEKSIDKVTYIAQKADGQIQYRILQSQKHLILNCSFI